MQISEWLKKNMKNVKTSNSTTTGISDPILAISTFTLIRVSENKDKQN